MTLLWMIRQDLAKKTQDNANETTSLCTRHTKDPQEVAK